MAGGKIDILVEPDVKDFSSKLESGLSGALGTAGKIGAALGVAVGLGELSKSVVSTGVEFQSQLNTMAAVSQATVDQLDAVSARARELGNSADLTATSAADAAAAMTELAKGGFTVEQSMEAAKGTLQLASAAQVDAATAATVQSQALQAFTLDASEASRVSDILAGAANASSAQMLDVSNALQQAGTVANQFGVSVDDTATAIAMFANAGITGSDAGTLLKTAMLSLAKQSGPAAQAVEELGLQVYDSQGKFVGLESIMGQLNEASKRMTDENYQWATATLFGSDAMRMAGIAASQGAEDFAALREAVTRQGQAAEVAAAQTAGLPGAIERAENAWEDGLLGIFDAVDEQLVGAANLGVDALELLMPAAAEVTGFVASAFQTLGTEVAANFSSADLEAFIGGTVRGFEALKSGANEVVPPLARITAAGVKAASAIGGSAWSVFAAGLSAAGAALKVIAPPLEAVSKLLESHPGLVTTAVGAWAGFKLVPGILGRVTSAAKPFTTTIKGVGETQKYLQHYLTASGTQATKFAAAMHYMSGSSNKALEIFGRSMFDATSASERFRASMLGLKGAAGGLVDALGGPWGLALMAAGGAVAAITTAHNNATAASESYASAMSAAADVNAKFASAVAGTTGALSEQAQQLASEVVGTSLAGMDAFAKQSSSVVWSIPAPDTTEFTEAIQAAAQRAGETSDAVFGDAAGAIEMQYSRIAREAKSAYQEMETYLQDSGRTIDDLNSIVASGGPEFDNLVAHIGPLSDGGRVLADQLVAAKAELDASVEAARRLDPAAQQAADGINVLADAAASGEDKLQALESVMQAMGLAPKDADEAMRQAAAAVDDLVDSAANASRPVEELGEALFDSEGELEKSNRSSRDLADQLNGLRKELENVAVNGGDVHEAFALMEPGLKALQREFGISDEKMQELIRSFGLMPDEISTVASVSMEGAAKDLATLYAQLYGLEEGATIEVSAVSGDAEAVMDALDIKWEKTADGKQIEITAADEQALAALQGITDKVAELGDKDVDIKALLDTTSLEMSAGQAQRIVDALAISDPTPQADLIINELLEKGEIAKGDLAFLAAQSPTPKADLDKALLDSGVAGANSSLDALQNRKTTTTVDANTDSAVSKLQTVWDMLQRIPLRRKIDIVTNPIGAAVGAMGSMAGRQAGGRIPAYAEGARHAGYQLPGSGPGTQVTDGFLALDMAGMPIARLDANEWVINGARSAQYNQTLAAINGGSERQIIGALAAELTSIPALAEGGRLSPEELLAVARGESVNGQQASRSLQGAPYVFGGYNWGDCSSSQGHLALAAVGKPAFAGRFMSTANEETQLASIGAMPGIGSGPRIAFGWLNGGPGGGHTSSTLYFADGSSVNLEMGGGAGGQGKIGGAAAGATSSQYSNHAHIKLGPGGELGFHDEFGVAGTSVNGMTLKDARGNSKTIGWGAAQSSMDLVNALMGASVGLYDDGGWLMPGQMAFNATHKPEPFITDPDRRLLRSYIDVASSMVGTMPDLASSMRAAAAAMDQVAGEVAVSNRSSTTGILRAPATPQEALADASTAVKIAASNAAADPGRYALGVGAGVLPEVFSGLADAEKALAETREQGWRDLEAVTDAEKELAEARKELAEAEKDGGGLSTAKKRKLEDAEKSLADARASGNQEKIAKAETKLKRAREDAAADIEKNNKKNADKVKKATEKVSKKEENLSAARLAASKVMATVANGQLALYLEVAKTAYRAVKFVVETVAKAIDWVTDKVNAVRGARMKAYADVSAILVGLAEAADAAHERLVDLQTRAMSDRIAQEQAMWSLEQARSNYQASQLSGILSIAQAQKKLDEQQLANIRVLGTSVDDLHARLIARLSSGKLSFAEAVDDVAKATGEKLALEAEKNKALADAMVKQKESALAFLAASRDAAKAALNAQASTKLLAAQAQQLQVMTSEYGGLSTPEAMRLEHITKLLKEAADWDAKDKKTILVEESRRYEAARDQALGEAKQLMGEWFGGDPLKTKQWAAEMDNIMSRAGHYAFWGNEDAIDAMIRTSSFGKAALAAERRETDQKVADHEAKVLEKGVEVGSNAIDAKFAKSELELKQEQASWQNQAGFFDAQAKYYRSDNEGERNALVEMMGFNRDETKRIAEISAKQSGTMEKLAESADNIYKRLQTITDLPDVGLDTGLPPSLIGVADQKANTAAMWQELLSHSQVRGVASAAVGAVDVAQVSTRYTTREEAEALRRERDAQLQKQIDAQLAKTRMEITSARIQANAPAERLPVTQVVLPGTPQTETAVVRDLLTELDAQGKRIEVLEGNDAAHYFASRM